MIHKGKYALMKIKAAADVLLAAVRIFSMMLPNSPCIPELGIDRFEAVISEIGVQNRRQDSARNRTLWKLG